MDSTHCDIRLDGRTCRFSLHFLSKGSTPDADMQPYIRVVQVRMDGMGRTGTW
jgi:hypothetical protein